jgi:hypothetical protein
MAATCLRGRIVNGDSEPYLPKGRGGIAVWRASSAIIQASACSRMAAAIRQPADVMAPVSLAM